MQGNDLDDVSVEGLKEKMESKEKELAKSHAKIEKIQSKIPSTPRLVVTNNLCKTE